VQKSRPLNQGEWHIKITLIHNPAAGDGSRPSGDDLVELLCAAGHKVNYQSSKEKKWKKALKKHQGLLHSQVGYGPSKIHGSLQKDSIQTPQSQYRALRWELNSHRRLHTTGLRPFCH